MPDNLPTSPMRQVFNLTSIVLFLVALVTGSTLVTIGLHLRARPQAVTLALGTGLLATATFAVLQSILQTVSLLSYLEHGLSNLVEPQLAGLRKEVGDLQNALLKGVSALNEDFLPERTYEASDQPNAQLNSDILADLGETDSYLFVGLSGSYTATRLASLAEHPNRLHKVVVVIADPNDQDAIRTRIRQEKRRPENLTETIEETALALVAFAGLRDRFELNVYLGVPPLNRIELFDNSVYLTLFGETAVAKFRFPRVLRFGTPSAWYRTYGKEINYLVERATPVAFPVDRTEQEFAIWLSNVVGKTYTASDVEALRNRFTSKCVAVERGEAGDRV